MQKFAKVLAVLAIIAMVLLFVYTVLPEFQKNWLHDMISGENRDNPGVRTSSTFMIEEETPFVI